MLADMLTMVREHNAAEEAKKTKKCDVETKEEELKMAFIKCKDSCQFPGLCVVSRMKQCTDSVYSVYARTIDWHTQLGLGQAGWKSSCF